MAGKSFVFRFGDVEVREREFSLTKAGEALPVEPKAFRVLLILLRNPQKLIPKDELLTAVWGETAVSENSLARSIALLRKLLGDEARDPRFIETVATVGYRWVCKVDVSEEDSGGEETPEQRAVVRSAGSRKRMRTWALAGGGALVLCLAAAIWYVHRPLPPPRISNYVPITHDGKPKYPVGMDGSRLYLNQIEPRIVAQVALTGGKIEPIAVPLPNPFVQDVSSDGSALLVYTADDGNLWRVGVAGNSVRHLMNAHLSSAAWSPDEKSLAYSTLDGGIYRLRTEDGDVQRLAAADSKAHDTPALDLSWSPNGETLRFTRDQVLWEMSSHGSTPHRLLPNWSASPRQCCGHWTPDGAFFLFLSGDSLLRSGLAGEQLWVLDERRTSFRQTLSQPIQLTSGPTHWGNPVPSRDGKKIFARGITIRGELERYDSDSRMFQPFLGGNSAEFVSFSKDGNSVAYVSFPDGILWKANRDGSHPVQLTDTPVYPKVVRWSPDGTRILFQDTPARGSPDSYIISSDGGKARPLLPNATGPVTDPNWSPDGNKVVFATCDCVETYFASDNVIQILDLTSHQVTTLPDSKGSWSPRWSPDGRYILALSHVALRDADPRVYDLLSKRWSVLPIGPIDFPTWSHDSRFIYFLRAVGDSRGVFRISVSGGTADEVADLKGIPITGWFGYWMGLDPTDAPLILRNVGTEDIYALTLEAK